MSIISYMRSCGRSVAGIIIAIVMMGYPAAAQPLSLATAIDKAVANYPLIHQREAEINAARAHVTSITDRSLPSFILHDQVNAGTANSMVGSYFPMGIIPSTSGAITAANNSDLSTGNVGAALLQWDIYNFGYHSAERHEAKAALATSEAYLSGDRYLLTESIISLYLDWLKKYRLLLVQEQNMLRAGTILSSIRATVLSGLKPGVDSSVASAEYARSRISYLQALADYKNGQVSIATYTGMDTAFIRPDTSVIARAAMRNTAQIPDTGHISAAQPLLNIYQKQYEQQLAANNALARRFSPRLQLQGAAWMRGSSISNTDTYLSLGEGLGYSRYNYLLGVALSYNIFDLRHHHDQVREGEYRASAYHAALQTQQLTLERTLAQANIAYSTASAKLAELPIQLYSAQQAYTQQLTLYKSGLNTLVDVTNALYALQQAETDMVLTQDEQLQWLYIRAGLSDQLDSFIQQLK